MTLYSLLMPAEFGRHFEIYLRDASGSVARVGHGTRRELMDELRDGNAINYLDREVSAWYVAWNGSVVAAVAAKKRDEPAGGWSGPDAQPKEFGAGGIARLPEAAIHELMDSNEHNLSDPSDKYARGYHDALLDIMDAAGLETGEKHFD